MIEHKSPSKEISVRTVKLSELNRSEVNTVSKFHLLKQQFNNRIQLEKAKYPFSDREYMFIRTINELLDLLDNTTRI